MKVRSYCSRWDFIFRRCRGRAVLHLGCIGETDVSVNKKLEAFAKKRVLHPHLVDLAREIVGVDSDVPAIELIRSRLGVENLITGDVEHLENLDLGRTFDIVLCGDLLEHLSCPGRVLEGARRFVTPASELIVSVPNSFALLANIRFALGQFREGAQHVASFSKFNLLTLLARHGFLITELYTCYDRPPFSSRQQLKLTIGTPFFKILPEWGGTLLAIAKKRS